MIGFIDYYSHTHIPTHVTAYSLKLSSYADYICRSKGIRVTKNKQKLIENENKQK